MHCCRTYLIAGIVLAFLFLSGFLFMADATIVKALTDEDLAINAQTILVGRCLSIKSEWNDEKTKIFTFIKISPQEFIKGQILPQEIIIKQPGGEVGEIGMRTEGTSVYEEGEEVLLFLNKGNRNEYRTIGLDQGKFSIETDKISGRKILLRKKQKFVRRANGKLEKKILSISTEKDIFLDEFSDKIRRILNERKN